LGIEPCFDLFRYFFAASLVRRKADNGDLQPVAVGSVGVHLRSATAHEYLAAPTPSTNQGWHQRWFYLRNDAAHPLPPFSGRVIDVQPECWRWGVAKDSKAGVEFALEAIRHLKLKGLTGAVVIGSYHQRRFAPLMARRLPMFKVTPAARVVGDTVMAEQPLADAEVTKRVRAAQGSSATWPIAGAPAMLPDSGAVDVVS
jgi:hypothetical protein